MEASSSLGLRNFSRVFLFDTTRWQAPELLNLAADDDDNQCRSTTASDIYAFACLCYEVRDSCPEVPLDILSFFCCLPGPQMFSNCVPFYETRNDYAIIIPVTAGKRPTRPAEDVCESTGLDQEMWDLINFCWEHEPAKRLTASGIVKILRSRLNGTPDRRPYHNWDMGFPSQLRSSLEENPLFPLRDYVEEALGIKCLDTISMNLVSSG
jgi:serine/threonine protein kinase